MSSLQKSVLAEFIATFLFVFVGVFAAGVAAGQGVVVPALAHGLILVVIVYVFGAISGAHINPSITVSLLLGGKIELARAVLYIVAQLLGAIAAALLAGALSSDIVAAGQTKGSLTETAVWTAALFESVLTFILATAVWQTAVHGRAGNLAGVAIGFSLAASILAGGLFTGASLNPARTVGPALVAGDLGYVLPYLVGIFGGGIVAALVHGFVLTPDKP